MIHGIQTGGHGKIYNPENIYVHKEGTGAGNNWAAGYATAGVVEEELMEMLDREADGSDSLEVRPPSSAVAKSISFHALKLTLSWYRDSCSFIPLLVVLVQAWAPFFLNA